MPKRILVVDDDAKCLILASDVLKFKGYEVSTAVNGQDAVEQAGKDRPDLILMDINMPVMNGLEATRALKQSPATAQIPVVALTASVMPSEQAMMIDAGMVAIIMKPINVRDFPAQVERHLPK